MGKLSEYASTGDSSGLATIDGKQFTITAVEDSPYEDSGKVTQGIKITTKESFDIEGVDGKGNKFKRENVNKFHTTRNVLVGKLSPVDAEGNPANQKLHNALAEGEEIGPVKCEKAKGKKYFILVDAE